MRMPRRDRDARRAARPWYRRLGPGLLAGASDDDPSGIAVYAQAGNWFGFHLLWLPVVVLPMMVEVQLAAASVGCGRYREGVVAANRRNYAARFAKTLIALIAPVVVVNVIRALYWSAVLNGVAAVPAGFTLWLRLRCPVTRARALSHADVERRDSGRVRLTCRRRLCAFPTAAAGHPRAPATRAARMKHVEERSALVGQVRAPSACGAMFQYHQLAFEQRIELGAIHV
ncbi:hypothetical protein WS63_31410 [Burkholderia stagnalis]|nr:hypothetical protein WS63_31410 [Burkholderia stagnalis]